MKGYKGFNKDLKCRDFQYEIGKEFETDEAVLCEKGFHFCKNPHDVFAYYGAGDNNRFCSIEAEDVSDEKKEDSKRACKKMKITSEISVFHICKIAVSTFFENFGFKEKIEKSDCNNAGYKGAANAGDCGAANAGDYGAANAGNYGAANAGYKGMQVITVLPMQVIAVLPMQDIKVLPMQVITVLPMQDIKVLPMQVIAVLPMQVITVLPMQVITVLPMQDIKGAADAGDCGAANAGDCGAAIVSNNGKVKGGYGCVLVARNIEYVDGKLEVTDWACSIVDGVNIKADTWYKLKDGKLIECDEE